MSRAALLTAFGLPGVSAVPSAKCLQWTADGQLLVLTKTAVYIMTPHVAVGNKLSLNIENGEEKEQTPFGDIKRMGWLRTMISIDKKLAYQWPADCQEWGAVALGSLDQGFLAVTSSPCNLSGDASCLLVALNSNMELTLWGPVKNLLTGEWTKLVDITAILRTHFALNVDSSLVNVLRAQSTCIEWSSQADFGLAPAPLLDGSFLAIGNRAGSVSFLRFCSKKDGLWKVECVATVLLGDRWVTHVVWSSWKQQESGTCEASLACGIADGSIAIIRIVQTLRAEASPSGLVPNYSVQASFEIRDVRPADKDGRALACMKWTEPSADSDMLIYSKPGKLYLWTMPSNGYPPSLCTIALCPQQLSVGSSTLTPVVGIEHTRSEDTLIVALADGSFQTVYHLSGKQPLVESSNDLGFSSKQLSANARLAFAAAEQEKVTEKDVNRNYGMVPYDHHSWFAWLHESCRPTDFSYKHDARHTCMLVVARLRDVEWESHLLSNVRDLMSNARAAKGESPLVLLRPAMLYLQDHNALGRVSGRLLDFLNQSSPLPDALPNVFPPGLGSTTPEMRQGITRSLGAYLFGSDALFTLRIRILVADLCARTAELDHDRQAFAHIAAQCNSRIHSYVQLAVLRHILSVLPALTDADVPFALRMVARACLPGSDSDVVEDAHVLSTKLGSTATNNDSPTRYEPCPACHAEVIFQDSATAVCPHGHVWTRCSVTSYIMATPVIRACSSCNSKAFLPLHQMKDQTWIPGDIRNSWLATDILNVAQRCLRCGCNFVVLL